MEVAFGTISLRIVIKINNSELVRFNTKHFKRCVNLNELEWYIRWATYYYNNSNFSKLLFDYDLIKNFDTFDVEKTPLHLRIVDHRGIPEEFELNDMSYDAKKDKNLNNCVKNILEYSALCYATYHIVDEKVLKLLRYL